MSQIVFWKLESEAEFFFLLHLLLFFPFLVYSYVSIDRICITNSWFTISISFQTPAAAYIELVCEVIQPQKLVDNEVCTFCFFCSYSLSSTCASKAFVKSTSLETLAMMMMMMTKTTEETWQIAILLNYNVSSISSTITRLISHSKRVTWLLWPFCNRHHRSDYITNSLIMNLDGIFIA